tara:strand:- start:2498 stop:2794 length:297 start_codon:yes stop_codon:yes gene_type:complete
MAIKEKQIPSPKDIKTSTISFSEEEIKELRSLKDEINNLTYDLGNLTIQKIKLEEVEDNAKKQLSIIENNEKIIAKKLTSKYGKGSINLESGTFTPIK